LIGFLSDTGELAAGTVLSLAFEHKGKELLQMTSWTESIRRSNLLSPADLIHLKEGKSTAKATRSTHAEQILTNQSYADALCLSPEQRRVLPFHADAYPTPSMQYIKKPPSLYIW
jgi:hypothetical protein